MEFGLELDEFCDLIGPEDMERMSAGIRTEADSKSAATEGDGSKKKAAGIAELLGVAVGAMGMNLADFCSMTPEEFRQAHGAWLEAEESRMRSGWEMARTLSAFILQPWSKKRLKPSDVLKFPWDAVARTERKSPPARSTESRFLKVKEMLEKGSID